MRRGASQTVAAKAPKTSLFGTASHGSDAQTLRPPPLPLIPIFNGLDKNSRQNLDNKHVIRKLLNLNHLDMKIAGLPRTSTDDRLQSTHCKRVIRKILKHKELATCLGGIQRPQTLGRDFPRSALFCECRAEGTCGLGANFQRTFARRPQAHNPKIMVLYGRAQCRCRRSHCRVISRGGIESQDPGSNFAPGAPRRSNRNRSEPLALGGGSGPRTFSIGEGPALAKTALERGTQALSQPSSDSSGRKISRSVTGSIRTTSEPFSL